MQNYFRLLENNKFWAEHLAAEDPEYFKRNLQGQSPAFLFIGCSDSRVPANILTGTDQGELFVHRNIAAQVHPNDLNLLSVLQFAIEVLDVKHVIVCGHYECGGVRAAASDKSYGLVDNWLGGIRAIRRLHQRELEAIPDETERLNRLGELSVIHQVHNLTLTPVVRQAWDKGRRPLLHGLVYSIGNGRLKELVRGVDGVDKAEALLPML
jgi:carbonic anhydrase